MIEKNQRENIISWHMNMTWHSNFGTHKRSFLGRQSCFLDPGAGVEEQKVCWSLFYISVPPLSWISVLIFLKGPKSFGKCPANVLIAGLLRAFSMLVSCSSCQTHLILALFCGRDSGESPWEVIHCTETPAQASSRIFVHMGPCYHAYPTGYCKESSKRAMLFAAGRLIRA